MRTEEALNQADTKLMVPITVAEALAAEVRRLNIALDIASGVIARQSAFTTATVKAKWRKETPAVFAAWLDEQQKGLTP